METLFWTGTSGWTYPDWKGRFYPEDLPSSRWFDHYARIFRSVEVNATFYRRFKDLTYIRWRDRAPEGFRYVLKIPRYITHLKLLLDVGDEIRKFWQQACLLEEKFGMLLLQLSPRTPKDPARLEKALAAFPDPRRVAVEFRNLAWLDDTVETLLRDIGAASCAADSPLGRPCDWLTSHTAYIRLHGRRRWFADKYTGQELGHIARLARSFARRGAKDVYVFFNNDVMAWGPENAVTLQAMLGR